MVSILDLPEEIIWICCKQMDFPTRMNLKKTCKFMNQFLPTLTKDQMKRWQEKVIGLRLFGNLMYDKKLDMGEKIYIDYDQDKQFILFSFTQKTIPIWYNLVKKYQTEYVMNREGYYHIRDQESKRGQFYFLVKDEESIVTTSNLLYDLYMGLEQKDKMDISQSNLNIPERIKEDMKAYFIDEEDIYYFLKKNF
jgi:hypothetical protein